MYTPVLQDHCSRCANKLSSKKVEYCPACCEKQDDSAEKKRRLRVIETAREIMANWAVGGWRPNDNNKHIQEILVQAIQFETAAEKYLKSGEV